MTREEESVRQSLNSLIKAVASRGLCPLDLVEGRRPKCDDCTPKKRTEFRVGQCWRAWRKRRLAGAGDDEQPEHCEALSYVGSFADGHQPEASMTFREHRPAIDAPPLQRVGKSLHFGLCDACGDEYLRRLRLGETLERGDTVTIEVHPAG